MAGLLGAGVLVAFLTRGTTTAPDPASAPEPVPSKSASPTVSRADLSALPVPRESVCAAVPEPAVQSALDGPVVSTAHYDNGEQLELPTGEQDVSHEFGCVWTGSDGVEARLWVFARPVSQAEARGLAGSARRGRGCRVDDRVGFGDPGVTSVCPQPSQDDEPRSRARLEGLFGQTWVGCEVSASAARTGREALEQGAVTFCIAGVTAAAATNG